MITVIYIGTVLIIAWLVAYVLVCLYASGLISDDNDREEGDKRDE